MGDVNAVNNENMLRNNNISVIINFGTNNPLSKYNICFPDSKNITYHEFIRIVSQTKNIILAHRDENILLACDRGVNRSAIQTEFDSLVFLVSYFFAMQKIDTKRQHQLQWHC